MTVDPTKEHDCDDDNADDDGHGDGDVHDDDDSNPKANTHPELHHTTAQADPNPNHTTLEVGRRGTPKQT